MENANHNGAIDRIFLALETAYPSDGDGREDCSISQSDIALILSDIMHVCDDSGLDLDFDACMEEARRNFNDEQCEDSGDFSRYGLAHSNKYTGWDRRHDDNKAEGRPVGNQWSDDGVYYVQGVKMHGKKTRS